MGREFAGVIHEGIERDVGLIFAVAQSVVGAIGKRFGIRAAPPILPSGGDGRGEILDSKTAAIVGRIVRAERESARGIEAVDPTPESILRIDFDRARGRVLVCPKDRIGCRGIQPSCGTYIGCEISGWLFQEFADLEPEQDCRKLRDPAPRRGKSTSAACLRK